MSKKLKTMIISAYAGVGKSWLARHCGELSGRYEFMCLDMDSSSYSKSDPSWTRRYIADILDNVGKYDFIFVSLRREVRNELHENDIPFITVAPDNSDFISERERALTKQQWFGRFLLRDNGHIKDFGAWLEQQADGYDRTMDLDNLTAYGAVTFFLLRHDQYLSDIIADLYEKKEHYPDTYDAARAKGRSGASGKGA